MASTRWHKLVEYYRSCISVENTAEVLFDVRNNGKGFCYVIDNRRLASGNTTLDIGPHTPAFRSFMESPRRSEARGAYFYGFPCDPESELIQPLFIFDVESREGPTGPAFLLQPNQPRLNTSWLGRIATIEEKRQASSALHESWDEDRPLSVNLDATLHSLEEVLPAFNHHAIPRNPAGVLFHAIDSVYTRGLEQELEQLMQHPASNDVWDIVLNRDAEPIDEGGQDIIEITSLNDEQRRAIRSAFVNQLTVVTGPPGTGKSQVVLNVIANALLHDETVLFGSKNNRAVDVVIERLSRTLSEPVILRYGNQQEVFADALLAALERALVQDDVTLDIEINDYEAHIARIQRDENEARDALARIVDRRNRIQQLQTLAESLTSEMPPAISAGLKLYDPPIVEASFRQQLLSTEQLAEDARRPNIITRIRSFFGQSLNEQLMLATQSLLEAMPDSCMSLPVGSRKDCMEVLAIARTLSQWADHQRELSTSVTLNWNEPRLETLRARIVNSQERSLAVNLKRVNALMKRRLKRLAPDQRRAVVDYANHLRALRNDFTGDDLRQEIRKASEKAFSKGVARAFPAIAVTNLSVRRAVPLTPDVFDIVVVDEASQCDIASALPLLYRGKRALVIGDHQQLTHISNLHGNDDVRLLSNAGLNSVDDQRFAYSANSLFDLARTTVGTASRFVHLLDHYRSKPEIIGFSNSEFYGNILNVHTDYRKLPTSDSVDAVTWHDVKGRTERPRTGSAYNTAEAQAVVDVLQDIIERTTHRDKLHVSLGVVTPFREQANRIQSLVDCNIDLKRLGVTIDTAHRYQGDERDIVIFSPVISRYTPESTLRFLGATSNLFNVAITRARAELHIVGDMITCAESGIPYLARFVSYVDGLGSHHPHDEQSNVFDSLWEEVFFDALRSAGIPCVPQYRFDQYKLDFAIPDKQIDIEIYGEFWHRNLDGSRVLSDLKRDTLLTARGWLVKRFWVYELQSDLDRCVRDIEEVYLRHEAPTPERYA